MPFCCLLIFSKLTFLKNCFIPSVCDNKVDPDQAQHFFGPDLGPNSLQKLSADYTSKKSCKTAGNVQNMKPVHFAQQALRL